MLFEASYLECIKYKGHEENLFKAFFVRQISNVVI
jgi:hypothetical protein